MTVVLTPANEKVGNCTLTWAEASRATSQTQAANANQVLKLAWEASFLSIGQHL